MAEIQIDHQSSILPNGHVARWFGQIVLESAEGHGIKITEARVRVYAVDLAGFEPARVIAAFRRLRSEGSGFFPQVAELQKQMVASPDDRAVLAWTAFERAAFDVGAYESLVVADGYAAEALKATFGGWPQFCDAEPGPEMALKRQAFLAAYREARRSTLGATATASDARLPGLCESAGTYKRIGAVWTARITAGGSIVHERERPELPDARSARQLTTGDEGTDDGEEDDEQASEGAGASGDGGPRDQAAPRRGRGVRRDPR